MLSIDWELNIKTTKVIISIEYNMNAQWACHSLVAEDKHIKKTHFSAFIAGTKIVNFLLKRYFCSVMLRLQSNPLGADTSLILRTVCFEPGERKPLHFL